MTNRMLELWKCADCGAVFDDPVCVRWKEEMSGDGWAWQTFTEYYCPNCDSQEIERYYGEEYDDAAADSL